MGRLILSGALESDIPRIQSLEEQAFGLTWDHKTFLRELERDNGATVVAKLENDIVGSALLVWAADEVQLNSIVLAPEFRGQGLSTEFLACMMASCAERELRWMTLEVKWVNLPAFRLYQSLGFVTTARRRAYYRDGQDARIMWAGDLQSVGHKQRLAPYKNSLLSLGATA